MDEDLTALPFHARLTRPNMPLRHPLSRAPLPLRPASGGLATPPFQSGVGYNGVPRVGLWAKLQSKKSVPHGAANAYTQMLFEKQNITFKLKN